MEESIIATNEYNEAISLVNELEDMEKRICNLPNVFAEILKDEINANDEQRLFNGFKRIIKNIPKIQKGKKLWMK